MLREKQLEIHIDQVCMLEEGEDTAAVSMLKKPDSVIIKITGWSVLRGADNCHYKRSLILEETEGRKIYTTEIMPCLREDVEKLYEDMGKIDVGKGVWKEKRIALSGMVARFELKALQGNSYRIGVLYEDMLTDQMYYRMLEERIEI